MMMNYVKARILFIYFIFYHIKIKGMLTQKSPCPSSSKTPQQITKIIWITFTE